MRYCTSNQANYLQGRALGFPDSEDGLPSSIVESTIANTAAIHVKPESTHVPSMLLDARKGQPIEVEVILGEVVRMAKDRGVPVPVGVFLPFLRFQLGLTLLQRIETLYGLLLVVQNQIIRKTTKL